MLTPLVPCYHQANSTRTMLTPCYLYQSVLLAYPYSLFLYLLFIKDIKPTFHLVSIYIETTQSKSETDFCDWDFY